jgi:hypothetical protein
MGSPKSFGGLFCSPTISGDVTVAWDQVMTHHQDIGEAPEEG